MKAVQVRRVQVAKDDDTKELYDGVWQAAQKVGVTKIRDYPKDFMEKFGGREQFLKQEEKQGKEA